MKEKEKRLTLAIYNLNKVYLLHEKQKKVSGAELCLMYALDDGCPHSQKEIAEEWFVPLTTVNTIIKRWQKEGYLILTPIPGKRREKQILLTEVGKQYAKDIMAFVYQVEERALKKTFERYSDEFIEALEYFGGCLKEAFAET